MTATSPKINGSDIGSMFEEPDIDSLSFRINSKGLIRAKYPYSHLLGLENINPMNLGKY